MFQWLQKRSGMLASRREETKYMTIVHNTMVEQVSHVQVGEGLSPTSHPKEMIEALFCWPSDKKYIDLKDLEKK